MIKFIIIACALMSQGCVSLPPCPGNNIKALICNYPWLIENRNNILGQVMIQDYNLKFIRAGSSADRAPDF